jgi:hypothetical protein
VSTAEPPRPSGGDDDIDAEFARLTEGLDLSAEDAAATEEAESAPFTVEDIISGGEDDEPAIAVVATSVASAKALAGAIRLGREARTDGADIPAGARVHDTPMGGIAVGALQEDAAHELAAVTSTALQRNGVVLFWRKGGRMTATRYREGERGEDVSPAIVMGAMDDLVEQLMLGAADPTTLGDGYDPAVLTRDEALAWIAQGRRGR